MFAKENLTNNTSHFVLLLSS